MCVFGMKDFPCKPPWTSYPACQCLLSTQVSQWATVIYCPNSAVLCQRLWLKSLTLQLLTISIFSPLFFFTFSNIVLWAHCYLPDTGAVPQGSIFSPLSQRVASLMPGLKNLEELHIGYLPCLPRAIYSGGESFLHDSNWHSGHYFFVSFFPFLRQKKEQLLTYLNQDTSLPIWDWCIRTFRTYSEEARFSGKSRHNPDFLNPKQMQFRICRTF